MIKRLSAVAVVFFLLTAFLTPAFAGTFSASDAIADALQNNGDYYMNYSGKVPEQDKNIHYITSTGLSQIEKGGIGYGFLAYGQPHPSNSARNGQLRYIGYTYYGEDYTNMDYPADKNANGADFASQHWIKQPWDNGAVKASNPSFAYFDGDGLSEYHTQIVAGIMAYGATNANNGFTIGTNNNPDFWNNIEQYVHILAPPTNYAWGIGRMWHYSGGSLWYVTVPIMPKGLLPDQDFAATSIDPGCQQQNGQYVAQADQQYTATVSVTMLKGDSPVSQVSVGGFHNVGGSWDGKQAQGGIWYSSTALTDTTGKPLQQGLLTSITGTGKQNNFYVGLSPSQTYKYQFTWSADGSSAQEVLAGGIDIDFIASNPLVQNQADIDTKNNIVELPITVEVPALVVTPDNASILSGETQQNTQGDGSLVSSQTPPEETYTFPQKKPSDYPEGFRLPHT